MSDAVPSADPGPTVPIESTGGVVAVLSHHASLAMQMRRAGFDILEGRDIDELTKMAASVDLVVVDLVAVDAKRGLVARLSTAVDPRVPLVLISADKVDLALLGSARSVHVVVPPVRADDVISQVRRILASRAAGARSDAATGSGPTSGSEAGSTSGTVTPMRDRKKLPPRRTPAKRVDDSVRSPSPAQLPSLTGRPGKAVPTTTARSARPAGEQAPAAVEKAAVATTSTPAVSPVAGNGSSSSTVIDLTALPAPVLDWRIVANQLTHAVQAIRAVPVVAQSMAEELAAVSGAHVAVMVRDDSGCWRVEAGVGLRSFEWAQTLEDDDWLIWAGRDQHPSLMVMDTDVVRGDLAGAPLASRYQLVRTHSTRAAFFVCAGWENDDGDQKERVTHVVQAVRRFGPAMSDSLGVRSFAQWLSTHVGGMDGVLLG